MKPELKLFRIIFRVRPTPEHPLFWELQCGLLNIWLFDADPEVAAKRAQGITEQLPYELIGEKVRVILDKGERLPEIQQGEAQARLAGIGIFLVCFKVGQDEGRFADDDWWTSLE